MARIRCFLLEPTEMVAVDLRRYRSYRQGDTPCPIEGHSGYHSALVSVGEEPIERNEEGNILNGIKPVPGPQDPRWPTQCACGYTFSDAEPDRLDRSVWVLYRRVDTGEIKRRHEFPAGAMWLDPHMDQYCVPQGEHCLWVRTPGGDWLVDGQSNNCGMPDDRKQEHHHCWIRHGVVPDITVDKQGGPTCVAGGGSIRCRNYHGFLRNGYLED